MTTAPLRDPASAPLPPPSVTGLDGHVPRAPTVPVLPPATPRTPIGASTVPGPVSPQIPKASSEWAPVGATPAPLAPSPLSFGRKVGRFVMVLLVFAVMASAALGGYLLVTRQINASNAEELPTFASAPPAYRSASFVIDATVDGKAETMVVTVDAAHNLAEVRLDTTGHLIVSGTDVFVESDNSTWLHTPATGDMTTLVQLTTVLRILMFDDLVPAAMRDYVTIVDSDDVTVAGRQLTRYELGVELERFRAEAPDAFTLWSTYWGFEGDVPRFGRMVLAIDDGGVVWQYGSYGDDGVDSSMITMTTHSDDESPIAVPTEFTEMAPGS